MMHKLDDAELDRLGWELDCLAIGPFGEVEYVYRTVQPKKWAAAQKQEKH